MLVPGSRRAEILHPIDLAATAAGGQRNADVLEPGIHDVRAMTRAGEPAGNGFLRRLGTKRDVLASQPRLITGANHPVFRLTAIVTAMIEELSSGHVARVIRGGIVQLA